MKTKIILLQAVFFILLLCIKFIFHTICGIGTERNFYIQSNIEIILEILLLLGLSFGMCRYILKSDKMIYISLWIWLSLSFLFEISKYVEHLLGFLPHYGDVPILISIALTLVAVAIYVSILYLICLFLKTNFKSNMKMIITMFFLSLIGCSTQISDMNKDTSLFFVQDENGKVRMSSLNSFHQIKITKYEYVKDTLIISYKRGAFTSTNNVLPLQEDTKYLKCANQVYVVERKGNSINIRKEDD